VDPEAFMARDTSSIAPTFRVPRALARRIEEEARRRRFTKSAVLRELIAGAFAAAEAREYPAAEARLQSLLVSGRASEKTTLRFIEGAADVQGWR
jgi:hypothetical protein